MESTDGSLLGFLTGELVFTPRGITQGSYMDPVQPQVQHEDDGLLVANSRESDRGTNLNQIQPQVHHEDDGLNSNVFRLISSLKSQTHMQNPAALLPGTLTWTRPISVAQTNAQFIQEHPLSQTPIKRKGGGRPRLPDEKLKRPRAEPRSKATRLRTSNPVSVQVPADVWLQVFHFTDYKTLLNLRLTCQEFFFITSREGFWKQYLDEHLQFPRLDHDKPSLPPNLSQMQHADLLLGQGCMGCGATKTKKAQWAFFRRWCQSCFSKNTMTAHEAQSISNQNDQLLNCIPMAEIDLWKNYVGVSLSRPESRRQAKQLAVVKKDLTNIFNEYQAYVSSLPSDITEIERDSRLSIWRDQKERLARQRSVAAYESQQFAKARQQRAELEAQEEMPTSFREARRQFFESKALKLDPPLNIHALQKIPGYPKSVEVKRKPSERAWQELLHNIQKYRAKAEREAALELARFSYRGFEHYRGAWWMRMEGNPAARDVLFRIADSVLIELEKSGFEGSDVAPEDFVYIVLREIRERYFALPLTEVPQASEVDFIEPHADGNLDSRYQLCFGDMNHLYEEKIAKHIDQWADVEKKRTATSLYCPGCTRNDYRRRFTFDLIFRHIRTVHCADLASPFRDHFHKVAEDPRTAAGDSIPWQIARWPRNLPILAPHQKATGVWNPDAAEYNRTPPKPIIQQSPFAGRVVRPRTPESDDIVKHVVDAILEAAGKLRNSPMALPFKARVAWNYAMWSKSQCKTPRQLTVHDLDQIAAALVLAGEFLIFSKVGCASCASRDLEKPHKYVQMKHPFETIITHWKHEHQKARSAAIVETELLNLPTDIELGYELEKETPDMEITRAAFDSLFPRETLALPATSQDFGSSEVNSGRRSEIDALNVLAEEAAKIDPRLREDWNRQHVGTEE